MREPSTLDVVQTGFDPEGIPASHADRHRRWIRLWATVSAVWRRWQAGGESVRALAALEDEDICHLSEAGRRLRQSARRQWQPPESTICRAGKNVRRSTGAL
jgi:hypothetical protein